MELGSEFHSPAYLFGLRIRRMIWSRYMGRRANVYGEEHLSVNECQTTTINHQTSDLDQILSLRSEGCELRSKCLTFFMPANYTGTADRAVFRKGEQSVRVTRFEWDDANINHIAEHRVSSEEAEEVFSGRWKNRKSRGGLYTAFGQTFAGRYLLVVFAYKGQGLARVITARDMTDSERKFCRKK
jgi:hypothetical protein